LMSTTATAITIARGCGSCSKHIHVKGFARAVSPPDGAWLARGWLTGRVWWAGDWGVHGDRRTVGQAPCPCSRNPDFTGLACRCRRVVKAPHSWSAGPQRLTVLATLHPTAGEPSCGVAPGLDACPRPSVSKGEPPYMLDSRLRLPSDSDTPYPKNAGWKVVRPQDLCREKWRAWAARQQRCVRGWRVRVDV